MRKLVRTTAGTFMALGAVLAYVGCGGDDSSSSTPNPDGGAVVNTGDASVNPTATCASGKTKCGDSCSDTKTDRENCGACGTKCGASEVCSAGACGLTCAGGTTKCGTDCVDTSTDEANCGACGNVCGAGQRCAGGADGGGACVCADGLTNCGGACVDTKSADNNCGVCGTVCGVGTECSNGACKGVVSEWTFEDNVDDSKNKNNGVIAGSVAYDASSWSKARGKSGAFAGGSVVVATPVDLPLTNTPRTLEAFVRPTGYTDSTYNGILSYGVRNSNGEAQLLSLRSNGYASSAQWSNDLVQDSGAIFAPLTTWSHVAFTWDGTMRRLYIDGILVQSDQASPFSTTNGELRIGSTDTPGRVLFGSIDDVRISNYARTEAQLRKTANQDIVYAFTAATDTVDSGPHRITEGMKSAAGLSAVADRKGAANSALAFDGAAGTQFQVAGISSLGKQNRPYTISVWVKPTAAAGGEIVHLSSQSDGLGWCLTGLGLDATGHPYTSSWPSTVAMSADAVAAGQWVHIAATWSASMLKLYVNGVLKQTSQQSNFAGNNTPLFATLGSAIAGGGCHASGLAGANFTGSMDDFKVFDRELSPAEIANEAK